MCCIALLLLISVDRRGSSHTVRVRFGSGVRRGQERRREEEEDEQTLRSGAAPRWIRPTRGRAALLLRPLWYLTSPGSFLEALPNALSLSLVGTYFQYKAKAIGAGSEGAQATLQDKYRDDLTRSDAEDLALEILKQVMEEKINSVNVEVAAVTSQVRTCMSHLDLDPRPLSLSRSDDPTNEMMCG